jgi:hypothetical protein
MVLTRNAKPSYAYDAYGPSHWLAPVRHLWVIANRGTCSDNLVDSGGTFPRRLVSKDSTEGFPHSFSVVVEGNASFDSGSRS